MKIKVSLGKEFPSKNDIVSIYNFTRQFLETSGVSSGSFTIYINTFDEDGCLQEIADKDERPINFHITRNKINSVSSDRHYLGRLKPMDESKDRPPHVYVVHD